MKFKLGDKVKLARLEFSNELEIGKIYIIITVVPEDLANKNRFYRYEYVSLKGFGDINWPATALEFVDEI